MKGLEKEGDYEIGRRDEKSKGGRRKEKEREMKGRERKVICNGKSMRRNVKMRKEGYKKE